MAYALLIVEPVDQRAERGVEAGKEVYAQMLQFTDDLKARGVLQAGSSLASQNRAARISTREGRTRVLDGPFAEAKEMIGGFFLVDCATREEALEIARQCPAAAFATIEVREAAPCYE